MLLFIWVWQISFAKIQTNYFFLAALQIPTCKVNPILGAKVNVVGTLNIFEAARKLREKKVSNLICSYIRLIITATFAKNCLCFKRCYYW